MALSRVTYFALLVTLLLVSQKSYAYTVSLVGVADIPGGTASNTGSTLTGTGHTYTYGSGILLQYRVVPSVVSLEFGALYIRRGLDIVSNGSTVEYSLQTIEIPLDIRYHIFPAVTIGFGAYLTYGFGSVSYYDTSTPSSSASSMPFGNNSFKTLDYGLLAGAAFRVKMFSSVYLLVDARYLYGLYNVSQSVGENIYLRDFQLLIGVSFGN